MTKKESNWKFACEAKAIFMQFLLKCVLVIAVLGIISYGFYEFGRWISLGDLIKNNYLAIVIFMGVGIFFLNNWLLSDGLPTRQKNRWLKEKWQICTTEVWFVIVSALISLYWWWIGNGVMAETWQNIMLLILLSIIMTIFILLFGWAVTLEISGNVKD